MSEIHNEAQDFGPWIRSIRNGFGMTLEEMARRVGLSRSYLSDLENGKRRPTRDVAIQFAEGNGMDTKAVLIRAGHPPADQSDPSPKRTAIIAELNSIFGQLSDGEQAILLDMARGLVRAKRNTDKRKAVS